MNRKFVCLMIMTLLAVVLSTGADVRRVKGVAFSIHSFYLYGNFLTGWGLTTGNITNPGPTIVVDVGDIINVTLVSSDGLSHKFFVDYNGNNLPDTGEPASPDFSGSSNYVNYQFTADLNGTFTYLCAHHPSSMRGTLIVNQIIPELSAVIILPLFMAATFLVAVIYKTKPIPTASRK